VDSVYGDVAAYEGTTCVVPQTLAPDAVYSCSIDVKVTGQPGSQPDYVTATGTDPSGFAVSSVASEEILITDVLPEMSVAKTAEPMSLLEPGGQATFAVQVTNDSVTGDPLMLTGLLDSLYGELTDPGNTLISDSTCTLEEIQPGATYTCSFKAQVSGVAGAEVRDTVVAAAEDDEGNLVEQMDDAVVTITALPPETGAGVPASVVVSGLAGLGAMLSAAGVMLRRRSR
jgi:hypothetical protein